MRDQYLLKRGLLYQPQRQHRRVEFAYDDEQQSFSALAHIHPASYDYWLSNPFDYRVNSWGHRGSEFEQGGVVMLGCSFTWGWGMCEQWSWPWLIGSELGLPVNCLGYPGEGGDRAAMLALGWIPELKPKKVYFLDLFTTRRTWLLKWQPGTTLFMNHDSEEGRKPQYQVLQQIAQSEAQEWFDQQRNLSVIREQCRAVGADLHYIDYGGYKKWVADQPRDRDSELKSRDRGNHPSREEHELIARAMLSADTKQALSQSSE